MLATEIHNRDLDGLKVEITAFANALYNKVLCLQNIQPNTKVLDMAELILKLNGQ